MANCINCGAELLKDSKFCIKCGTPTAVQPVEEQSSMKPQEVEYEQPTMEPQGVEYEQPTVEPQGVEYEQPEIEPQGFQTAYSDFETPEIAPAQSSFETPEIAPAQFGAEQPQQNLGAVPTYQSQSAYEPIAPVQPAYQAIPNSQQVFSNIPQEPKKSKKGPIIAFVSIAVVAIAAIVVALVMLLTPNVAEIDLTKYITVEYEGTDSVGTAVVTYDKTRLLIDILREQGEDPSDAASSKLSLSMNALMNSIEFEVSQSDNLSNGDKITVTVKYDSLLMEENNIDFTKNSKDYTVEKLVELIEIDPFEDITVEFYGTSPNGYVSTSNSSDIDCVRWAYFEFDVDEGLRNGDTVTLRIDEDDVDSAVSDGYKFTATSKEYTVEGLDYYYEAAWQISDEHMEAYRKEADEEIEYEISWLYNAVLEDVKCIGSYFAKSTEHDTNNKLIFVYTATVSSTEGEFAAAQIYIPIVVSGMLVEDGKVEYMNASSRGGISVEGRFSTIVGYVSGDVMYTELILGELGEEYEVTASDDLPQFKETTDENVLPAATDEPAAQTPADGTTGQTPDEDTIQDKPDSVF